jgi:hypothetical protein
MPTRHVKALTATEGFLEADLLAFWRRAKQPPSTKGIRQRGPTEAVAFSASINLSIETGRLRTHTLVIID